MKWSGYLLVITGIAASLFLLAPGGADNAGGATVVDTAAVAPRDADGFQKPDDATLRQRLSPLQYEVTQQDGTEQAFRNEYWDNKRAGIYVDIVSGEPLFSSTDKFKSGTGWPSFTRPIEEGVLNTHEDTKFFMKRTELRSRLA
ncbi:MAG: peptide-methionine (R)-S-oxide reductase MsrB, partial [Gammaproteobacteria bacterium]|nr:peptide-methionine (R)-S-oxide reductase MsrB [Gammaproteobacteria bacterium]